MSGLNVRQKKYFPLTSNEAVVKLFKDELLTGEPDLTLLSLVAGYLEHKFCVTRELSPAIEPTFPSVPFATIDVLYKKFQSQVRGHVDLSEHSGLVSDLGLVKRVSDVVWANLSRNYQDRAHLQSLYSLLTTNKLDCFGVALACVAACQQLGLGDVHLALAEDHAWLVLGGDKDAQTLEVTWHGKGNEDKRGKPITAGLEEQSWLYLSGDAVVCTRAQETAAMVTSINPAITAHMDSAEMAQIQQELLWTLYDMGHLARYPMALSNLAECEEMSPSPGRPHTEALHYQAVLSAQRYYNNGHVYPLTTMGSYLMRHGRHEDAAEAWARAASAIAGYNYSREDEEIYKEFLEIAMEHLPAMLQTSGYLGEDPVVFANLLRFYDGMCTWEEGSSTPVLHEGWANTCCRCVAHFPANVRQLVKLEAHAGEGEQRSSRRSLGALKSPDHVKTHHTPDLQIRIQLLEKQVGSKEPSKTQQELSALAQECTHSILNPEYLLGRGEPFSTHPPASTASSSADENKNEEEKENKQINGDDRHSGPSTSSASQGEGEDEEERRKVSFTSAKMCALISLLHAERLNNPAIRLQLTAQSQVSIRPHRRAMDSEFTTFTSKRRRSEQPAAQ